MATYDATYYKLVDRCPVPCTFQEYADFKDIGRDDPTGVWSHRVAWFEDDTVEVSTVFLGYPACGSGGTNAALFETMCDYGDGWVDPPLDMVSRYATWDEAELGHDLIVEKLKERENGSV